MKGSLPALGYKDPLSIPRIGIKDNMEYDDEERKTNYRKSAAASIKHDKQKKQHQSSTCLGVSFKVRHLKLIYAPTA